MSTSAWQGWLGRKPRDEEVEPGCVAVGGAGEGLPAHDQSTSRPELPLLPELFELRRHRDPEARCGARMLVGRTATRTLSPVVTRWGGPRTSCANGILRSRTYRTRSLNP
jgi:hypothetical protein